MNNKTFFTKLDNAKKIEILDFLIHNSTPIVLKVKNEHYKSKILNRTKKGFFSIYKFSLINFNQENVMCSFSIRDEKYFFKSMLSYDSDEFRIDIPVEVFQLQRRNDFRINIPIGLSYICEIKRMAYPKGPFKVELRDISLGGCQIAFPSKLTTVDDGSDIDLKIIMNQFENDKIPCTAKHIKKIEKAEMTIIGLKFFDPSAELLTDLQGLLVYLDRVHRGKGYE